MKRSWVIYTMVFGLGVLLLVLGTLQYRWLNQISISDREKERGRVHEDTERFAGDFNREIQQAYFNFQTDAESWQNKSWTQFNERYAFWRNKSIYPGLISDFYFFEVKSDTPALRYDRDERIFKPVDLNAELANLRSSLTDEKNFRPIVLENYTLVVPVHETPTRSREVLIRTSPNDPGEIGPMLKRYGYLVIRLDPETIKDQLIPDLTNKYFASGEYRVAISDRDGQPIVSSLSNGSPDASAALFDLSADSFMFFANKELMSTLNERHENVIVNSRVENHTLSTTETVNGVKSEHGGGKAYKIELQSGSKPRREVFTATTSGESNSGWTLQVQHVSGSLDAYMASMLRRNLAVGFGLLFLLAGAIAAIVISAQRAKALAQRQIDFVSSVSHEFRTPLAVIYSAGENLADGIAKDEAQVARYGDLLKGEGSKLTGMVEQILDFAGANSGKKKYRLTTTSVKDVVEDALDDCGVLIEEREFEVITNIADDLPMIQADKIALSQAIQNLIGNSMKYSDRKRWIRVSAENGDSKIKISVEDRGIGISKSDLRQVFEPFYRSKKVVDAQIHGNGLGLALVKQIVEAHGGRVTATSEPGVGSKFTIEIPQG